MAGVIQPSTRPAPMRAVFRIERRCCGRWWDMRSRAVLVRVGPAFAAYTPTAGLYGETFTRASKTTESSHSTLTDVGGAYNSNTGEVWLTYCGTNSTVYYQEFAPSGTGGGTEQSTGNSCNIDTVKVGGITYYNGGVGVSYAYSTHDTFLTWPANSTVLINADVL